jgi:GT2 family glycosyltransferase
VRPTVSVVIPARNAADTIGEQLDALAMQDFHEPWEVVVADNGSTDATAPVARGHAGRLPGLKVVDASHRVGINAGRNGGIRAAAGELVLICDADDVVAPGWIAAHHAALRSYDISGGPLDEVSLNPPEVARLRTAFDQDQLVVAGRFLPYAFGGNLGVRRAVWERLGGFDEDWVRGGTEIEFCWRAQLAGFTIGFTPGAVVAYRYGRDIKEVERQVRKSARSQARLYRAFRTHGMPRTRTKPALVDWLWLGYHLPDLLRGDDLRVRWRRRLAWRWGLLRGSVEHRVLYL